MIKKHALLAVFLSLAVALACHAAVAATISYSDGVPLTDTDWTENVSLPKFDPALGTLNSVTCSLAAHAEGSLFYENLSPQSALVTSKLQVQLVWLRPDGSQLLAIAPLYNYEETVPGYDGTLDFAGTSGRTYPFSVDDSDTHSSPPPASDLALFTGTDNITFEIDAVAVSKVTGPGNLAGGFSTHVSALVTVAYDYTPPPCSIGDMVWLDVDGDGLFEPEAGDIGINGVTVELYDSGGALVASAVTANDPTTDKPGWYLFENLVSGAYTVVIPSSNFDPGGPLHAMAQTFDYDGTLDNQTSYTLAPGQDFLDADFGYTGTGSIGDTVWNDLNGNGVQESGEPGFAGIVVTLKDGDGNDLATKTTDANGLYLFSNLTAGIYTVSVAAPAGFTQSYDLDGVGTPSVAVAPLTDGQNRTDVDFGYTANQPSCQLTTFTQGGWGSKPSGGNPGMLLKNNFSTIYPGGSVTIGGVFTLKFTSARAIQNFLPQGSTPGVLRHSYTNPSSRTEAGVFAGQVLALRLNVDFANAGVTCPNLPAAKLTCGGLSGYTVAQVLALAEAVLGGDTSGLPHGMTISQLNDIVTGINEQYDRN